VTYYPTIEEDLKRAKEILEKGAATPQPTSDRRSKWCEDGKDAESHGWCSNRDSSETHCGCACHRLPTRNLATITAWLAGVSEVGGTIYGGDTYAAYKLLESFVAEIERLQERHTDLAELLNRAREEHVAEIERLQTDVRMLSDRFRHIVLALGAESV
jgi:hypothetical protein